MASSTVPVISHPHFPQVLDGILSRLIALADQIAAQPKLDACTNLVSVSWGMQDATTECGSAATVSEISHGDEYCLACFNREVARG